MYNFSGINGIDSLVTATDTMSAGTFGTPILGYIILIITYIMFFVSMKDHASEHAFMATNLLILPVILFMASLGLVNPLLFYLPLTFVALSMIFSR
jgi:hypothetical protein